MTRIIRLALAGAAAALWVGAALAQEFPTRPVHIVVPWPAGGVDLLPRTMSEPMTRMLGQQVVVENRAGAGGTIGIAQVAKAEPDGYTLVMTDVTSHAISGSLYKQLPYDVTKDLAPIALVARSPLVLVVSPALGVKTFKEFLDLAKAKPGVLAYASSGNGAITHLAFERLKRGAGIDLVHIPYKGSAPAVAAVIAGETAAAFSTAPAALGNVAAGKLVALAVTFEQPLAQLPGVPPIAEFIPGYRLGLYQGLLAPAGTPQAVIDRLHATAAKALQDEKVKTVIKRGVFEPLDMSPAQFGRFLDEQVSEWARVVRQVGLTID
jgi:tripartite-type tricarboxylate transporter receptor subunit TctC